MAFIFGQLAPAQAGRNLLYTGESFEGVVHIPEQLDEADRAALEAIRQHSLHKS